MFGTLDFQNTTRIELNAATLLFWLSYDRFRFDSICVLKIRNTPNSKWSSLPVIKGHMTRKLTVLFFSLI
jgi:hypothetical protein